MKIIVVFLALLISCTDKKETVVTIGNFQEINYSLQTNYLDSVAKKIIPNGKYQYWAYATFHQGYGDKKITRNILKEAGDTLVRKNSIENFKPFGFFEGGHPSYRCNFAVTIQNNRVRYIRNEEELRNFIGTIDNLEEALLLAHTFNYQLDTDLKAKVYKELEDGYELHLMKYHDHPRSKELIDIKIKKNGFIKTRSLGIYQEGEDIID